MTKELYTKGYFRASWKFQTNKERLNRLTETIIALNPKSVLDVGCGRGYLMRELEKRGIDTRGVDFSPAAVGMAKWSKIICADANNLPFPDTSFDLVVSTDFFEHIPENEVENIFNEMRRVGQRVAAVIETAEKSTKKNAYHCTVQPLEWWARHCPGIIFI